MSKSHVSMEQHLCEVCGKPFDTGAILLDRRLRQSLEVKTVTAMEGKCPDCAKLEADGYVALVAANPKGMVGDTLKHEDADRTGALVHIKRDAYLRIFNCPLPPKGMAYCEPEVIERLAAMSKGSEA